MNYRFVLDDRKHPHQKSQYKNKTHYNHLHNGTQLPQLPENSRKSTIWILKHLLLATLISCLTDINHFNALRTIFRASLILLLVYKRHLIILTFNLWRSTLQICLIPEVFTLRLTNLTAFLGARALILRLVLGRFLLFKH